MLILTKQAAHLEGEGIIITAQEDAAPGWLLLALMLQHLHTQHWLAPELSLAYSGQQARLAPALLVTASHFYMHSSLDREGKWAGLTARHREAASS